MESTTFVLMGLFFLAVNIPCVAITWLGVKFIEKLGRYPSKTAAIQMSICLKLIVIEVGAFTFLLAMFKVLAPSSD